MQAISGHHTSRVSAVLSSEWPSSSACSTVTRSRKPGRAMRRDSSSAKLMWRLMLGSAFSSPANSFSSAIVRSVALLPCAAAFASVVPPSVEICRQTVITRQRFLQNATVLTTRAIASCTVSFWCLHVITRVVPACLPALTGTASGAGGLCT